MRRRARALRATLVVVLGAGCGGSRSTEPAPTPSLATTAAAQQEMRALAARWSHAGSAERAAMEPEIAAFRRRHAADGVAPLADAMLAWAALERGDVDEALRRARRGVGGRRGPAFDTMRVVEGAALRRKRDFGAALGVLSPLVGKLVDADARRLFDEEIVLAALGAKRWDLATDHLRRWLSAAADGGFAPSRERVDELIASLPPDALETELDRELARPAAPGDDGTLRRAMTAALARGARESGDVRLARHLLHVASSLLGDDADAIAELAGGAAPARIEARTVGLLLSLRSEALRWRGAEVAAGVAHGMGIPGSSARLATRVDHGDLGRVEEALAGLGADGAALVVAGLDSDDAAIAADFAEAHEVPVVLLHPPRRSLRIGSFRYVYVLGEEPAAVAALLRAELTRRGAAPVGLLEEGTRGAEQGDDARAEEGGWASIQACEELAEKGAWTAPGLKGLVVAGDGPCAREAIAALARVPDLRLGLIFGAEGVAARAGTLVATAGAFPLDRDAAGSPLRAFSAVRPEGPSWWAALGRDAGVLAWAAVQALPARGTEDPAEVRSRRAAAAARLASAEAPLWTTEARGFGGARVLPRTVRVREVP